MRVIICGAGQVGYGIAEHLAAEGIDVTVIDNEEYLIQDIRDLLDVRGIVGHGSHPDVLSMADAGEADMLIAVTHSDEVNMIACQVAHTLFNVPTKIARIRSQIYRESQWGGLFARDKLPIDVIISPEVETGELILRRLTLPGVSDVVTFIKDQIYVLGFTLLDDCPIVDTPLGQLSDLFPDLMAVVVGINRSDSGLIIPKSDDIMQVGDEVYITVQSDNVERTLNLFGHKLSLRSKIAIAGGGNIGAYVAKHKNLYDDSSKIKLIESNHNRATQIAEFLPRSIVIHGDVLDKNILNEAEIKDTDTIIAVTNDDETNILCCVMAKQLGCKSNLCLVNNTNYLTIANSLGIDAFINPRVVTISKILHHIRRGLIRSVYSVFDGKAEVIEAEALETSPLVGKPLRDIKLLEGVRIGAIYRQGKIIMPTGESRIKEGDRVILMAARASVKNVEQMFRVSLNFF